MLDQASNRKKYFPLDRESGIIRQELAVQNDQLQAMTLRPVKMAVVLVLGERPGLVRRFYGICRHWGKRASRQDELLWSSLRFQALFNSGMLREARRAFRPDRARPRRLDVPK
jgi:hypothetical protein